VPKRGKVIDLLALLMQPREPPLKTRSWSTVRATCECIRMRTWPILVSVTKVQLAEQLALALELSKEKAEKTVEAVFAAIVKALKDGEKLDIRGFGNFKVKDQPARQARNPRTGEAIAVPAKKVAVFKPGKELAEALNPATEAQSRTSTLIDPTL
jgi:DNA-binding protein HU-beta